MASMHIGSIEVELVRKPIKHLNISVLPPAGQVRVAVPENMSETALRMAVINKIPWIKKQQADFAKQPRQSNREMVSGECHYLWGKRYRLNVVETRFKHGLSVQRDQIQLQVRSGTTAANRQKVLAEFYRSELQKTVAPLIEKWAGKMQVSVSDWRIKKMKTKWGSCNIEAKRIWLNLELAKKPFECLEFVVVHEMAHLLERHHNNRFKALMNQFLPDWIERKAMLNGMPL